MPLLIHQVGQGHLRRGDRVLVIPEVNVDRGDVVVALRRHLPVRGRLDEVAAGLREQGIGRVTMLGEAFSCHALHPGGDVQLRGRLLQVDQPEEKVGAGVGRIGHQGLLQFLERGVDVAPGHLRLLADRFGVLLDALLLDAHVHQGLLVGMLLQGRGDLHLRARVLDLQALDFL